MSKCQWIIMDIIPWLNHFARWLGCYNLGEKAKSKGNYWKINDQIQTKI